MLRIGMRGKRKLEITIRVCIYFFNSLRFFFGCLERFIWSVFEMILDLFCTIDQLSHLHYTTQFQPNAACLRLSLL